jgi:hypothetical protein
VEKTKKINKGKEDGKRQRRQIKTKKTNKDKEDK